MMDGTITLESEYGKGSAFKVRLHNVNIQNITKPVLTENNELMVMFNESTLLLVDDMVSNRMVVRGFLETHNIKVYEADNGQSGIDMARKIKPNIILMDMNMPVMDGFEASRLIKRDENLKNIPIVALTALTMKEQTDEILNVCDDYVKKPIAKHELIKVLIKYLPYKEIQSELHNTAYSPPVYDFINEMKTHIAISDSIPSGFLNILNFELIPIYEKIKVEVATDDIEEFALTVKNVANKYNIKPVIKYCDELLKCTNAFDFDKIFEILPDFQHIIDIINNSENS